MFVGFRLKKGRDDDIIKWLNSIDTNDRSYHIREHLRAKISPTKTESLKSKDNSKETTLVSNNAESNLDNWM